MKIDKRSALKQGQIDILETLYKYRFGSRQLLADSLGIKSGSNLFEKLNVNMVLWLDDMTKAINCGVCRQRII